MPMLPRPIDPPRPRALPALVFVLLLLAAAALPGCASYTLPAITAEELHYRRTDPAGGTEVTAKNVRVDGDTVRADEAAWNTTYPAVSVSVRVKGYERRLPVTKEPRP